jgi:probable F420-dependent oxidoreductase
MTSRDSELDVGVMVPPFSSEGPHAFRELAVTAEDAGFDAVWFADHITFPEEMPQTYPATPDGTPPFSMTDDAYDIFQVLAHIASITDEVALGSNVCIAPYRHPVTLTKHALTLDSLSDGRFEFGVAPGWLENEFEVLDVPFEHRGALLDEFLEIFTRACETGEFAFEGDHHSFQKTGFHPRPVDGRPPLWIGGDSPPTYRRVGQVGDGWTILWKRPDDLAETREKIMRRWEEFDRSGVPEISIMRPIDVGNESGSDPDRPLIGSPEEILEDVEAYREAGATRIVMDFATLDLDEQLRQVERVGRDIIPSV